MINSDVFFFLNLLWYQEHCLKISGLYNENCERGTHLKFVRYRIIMTQCYGKGDLTFDNKQMNLCEIGLFHIVLGASKGTRENYPEI